MGSIFDRYGGFAVIRKVVSEFYDRVLDSPQLSSHFAGVDMRSLINHQTQFIAYLTGGPGAVYTDDALRRVHAPLGITEPEVEEMRRLLRETLEDLDFDPADIKTIDGEMEVRTKLIVGAS
ncbi:group 1 truncated hemoglobin [Egicoccus sp. AB-alg2]|uniref:group I truncated hemoglobin n=1 Tax=Egicoccus sp. AB-alg2 TaxID=3242693 RepID=UPI00359D00DD